MKGFNLPALLIALGLVIGTIGAGLPNIGRQTISDCYKNLTLRSKTRLYPGNIGTTSCTILPHIANGYPYVQWAQTKVNISDTFLYPGDEFFCATLKVTTDTDAPLINLGDGLKRYMVDEVFCVLEDTD